MLTCDEELSEVVISFTENLFKSNLYIQDGAKPAKSKFKDKNLVGIIFKESQAVNQSPHQFGISLSML